MCIRDRYPQDIADKMADLGLFGATISPEYGGLGLSAVTYSKIVENVSAVWMSVSGKASACSFSARTCARCSR